MLGIGKNVPSKVFGVTSGLALGIGLYCVAQSNLLNILSGSTVPDPQPYPCICPPLPAAHMYEQPARNGNHLGNNPGGPSGEQKGGAKQDGPTLRLADQQGHVMSGREMGNLWGQC